MQVQDHVRELVEKTIELEAKLAIPERETTKLEAKLKRAGAAMFKLRMEVADVVQAEYEATDAQKALLKEAVGAGYGAQESGKRLLRLHAAEIVEHIQRKAGDDALKQMELGKAVHQRLSTRESSVHADENAINAAIVDGVREWCATLKTVYNGRFPNEVRAGYLKVLQSVGHKCAARRGPYTAAATARVLGVKAKHLIIERLRWEDWLTGDTDQFLELRVAMRRDKFPEEWADFIVDMWLSEDITRQSESAVHVCRNPKSRKDKYEYRIHWLEKKIEDVVRIINEKGKVAFPFGAAYKDDPSGDILRPEFGVSWKYVTALRPFQVKPARRELCLCRYHLQWEMIADAVYNLRKSLRDRKLVDDSTCKCKNHKDAFALRRALTCAREDGQKYDKPICANNLCRDCRDLGKLTSLMCEAEWAHVKDVCMYVWPYVWPYVYADLRVSSAHMKKMIGLWTFKSTSP